MPRNAGSPLARASERLTGESGATSTTRRPEAWASAAKTGPARQVLIGHRPPILVRMATIPHCGQARNRGALAQGRIPFVREAIVKVRRPVGRRQTSKEVQDLIFRMLVENSTWGAPRIHGELLMLGFDGSERTISRWMKRAPRDPEPAKRLLTFLRNHRETIAAMESLNHAESFASVSARVSVPRAISSNEAYSSGR